MKLGFSGFRKPRPYTDFIFIHINKTAGSSIEEALGLYFMHHTVNDVIDDIGQEKWNNAFTFSFVRNPWDKVASHYRYRYERNVSSMKSQEIDFRTWLNLAYVERKPRYFNNPVLFMPQVEWLKGPSGRIEVDFIGRFERLEQDFNEVCDKLGFSATLPHLKATRRSGSYRDLYSDETESMVGDLFAPDIDRFGYEF